MQIKTKNFIYLLAVFVTAFTLSLYIPKFVAYAQDKTEQRKINQQILDLELELSDIQNEWSIFDDAKIEKKEQINILSWEILDIEKQQDELHARADEIRKEIDILKWDASLNDELINCYQRTWDLYNDCLDAIIQVGLQQRRQPQ